MTTILQQGTTPFDASERTNRVGLAFTRTGLITLDADVGEYFKMLKVGTTGGDIVYIGPDGNPNWLPNCVAGSYNPAIGFKVVTSATVNGVSRTTTATPVVWCGGA